MNKKPFLYIHYSDTCDVVKEVQPVAGVGSVFFLPRRQQSRPQAMVHRQP